MRVRYRDMIGGVGGFVMFRVIRGVLRCAPIRNQLRPISLTFSSLRTVDGAHDTYGKQQLLHLPIEAVEPFLAGAVAFSHNTERDSTCRPNVDIVCCYLFLPHF